MKLNNFIVDPDLQGTDIIHFPQMEIQKKGYKLGQIITIGLIPPSSKGVILTIGWNPDHGTMGPSMEQVYDIESHVSPFYHKRLLELYATASNIGTEPEIKLHNSMEQIERPSLPSPSLLIIKLPEQINEKEIIQFRKNAVNNINTWIAAKKILNFNVDYTLKQFQFVLVSQTCWGRLDSSALSNIPVLFSIDFENWHQNVKKFQHLVDQIKIKISETLKNKNNIATLFPSIVQKLTQVETIPEAIFWKKASYFCTLILLASENEEIQNKLSTYNNHWLKLKDDNNKYCDWGGQERTCAEVADHIRNHRDLKTPSSISISDTSPSFGNRDREIREKVKELERHQNSYEDMKKEYEALRLNENISLNEINLFFKKPNLSDGPYLEMKIKKYEEAVDDFTKLLDAFEGIIIDLNSLLKNAADSNRSIEKIQAFDKAVVQDNMETIGQWIEALRKSVDTELPWNQWIENIQSHYDALNRLIIEFSGQRSDQSSEDVEQVSKKLIAWIKLLEANISESSVDSLFSFTF